MYGMCLDNRQMKMKVAILVVAALVAVASFSAKAQVLFGNTPTGTYGGDLFFFPPNFIDGEVFGFTANQNFTISSMTMTLSNYTSSINLILFEGNLGGGFGPQGLQPLANFAGAAPNDGSAANFTFGLFTQGAGTPIASVTLLANDNYWIAATSTQSSSVHWMLGTTPMGDATYLNTYLWNGQTANTAFPEPVPFFTLNAVPEPSTWALLVVGAGAVLIRRRRV